MRVVWSASSVQEARIGALARLRPPTTTATRPALTSWSSPVSPGATSRQTWYSRSSPPLHEPVGYVLTSGRRGSIDSTVCQWLSRPTCCCQVTLSVRSSTSGETCRKNFTLVPSGVMTWRNTEPTCRLIVRRTIASNSASIVVWSAMMSVLPRSASEISRNSAWSQSVPKPRQSHSNRPRQRSSSAVSAARSSPSSCPSVSRSAWLMAPGRVSKSPRAMVSHCEMAVPPPAFRRPTASLAAALVAADA